MAVNKSLQDLAREGKVSEASGKYEIATQPPEAPAIEEPPAPPEPPPVEAPPPVAEIPAEEATPDQQQAPSFSQQLQQLKASVAALEANDELAVLEVMKTFQESLTPGTIAGHLTAVNWNFEGVHPRVAVNKALKDLIREGKISESGGQYQIVEQPPEAPVIEEPPAPPLEAPPQDSEASIRQGRQDLEASMAILEVNDEVAVLEVMKTFQEPLSPDTIGEHLAAVNWDFEDRDPQEAISESLQNLLARGMIKETNGSYEISG